MTAGTLALSKLVYSSTKEAIYLFSIASWMCYSKAFSMFLHSRYNLFLSTYLFLNSNASISIAVDKMIKGSGYDSVENSSVLAI